MRKGQHHTERSRALTSAKLKAHDQTPQQLSALSAGQARRAALQRFENYEPWALAVRGDSSLAPRWVELTETHWERLPATCCGNTAALCECFGIQFVWCDKARKFAFQVAGLQLDQSRSDLQGIALILERAREHRMRLSADVLRRHLHILSIGAPTLEQMCRIVDFGPAKAV